MKIQLFFFNYCLWKVTFKLQKLAGLFWSLLNLSWQDNYAEQQSIITCWHSHMHPRIILKWRERIQRKWGISFSSLFYEETSGHYVSIRKIYSSPFLQDHTKTVIGSHDNRWICQNLCKALIGNIMALQFLFKEHFSVI